MNKMTEKKLIARDRRRDIGAELLQAVRQMKAGKARRMHQVKLPEALEARMRFGLAGPLSSASLSAQHEGFLSNVPGT